MRRRNHQASAYVTNTERDQFEEYAAKFFLDVAGLLALLFARETRVGQLCALTQMDVAPQANRNAKLTARLSAEEHAMLTKLAKDNHIPLSQAGAIIVRAELRDQWLEKVVSTRFES